MSDLRYGTTLHITDKGPEITRSGEFDARELRSRRARFRRQGLSATLAVASGSPTVKGSSTPHVSAMELCAHTSTDCSASDHSCRVRWTNYTSRISENASFSDRKVTAN